MGAAALSLLLAEKYKVMSLLLAHENKFESGAALLLLLAAARKRKWMQVGRVGRPFFRFCSQLLPNKSEGQ